MNKTDGSSIQITGFASDDENYQYNVFWNSTEYPSLDYTWPKIMCNVGDVKSGEPYGAQCSIASTRFTPYITKTQDGGACTIAMINDTYVNYYYLTPSNVTQDVDYRSVILSSTSGTVYNNTSLYFDKDGDYSCEFIGLGSNSDGTFGKISGQISVSNHIISKTATNLNIETDTFYDWVAGAPNFVLNPVKWVPPSEV